MNLNKAQVFKGVGVAHMWSVPAGWAWTCRVPVMVVRADSDRSDGMSMCWAWAMRSHSAGFFSAASIEPGSISKCVGVGAVASSAMFKGMNEDRVCMCGVPCSQ